ncbi:hypothetical protein HHK36_028357 [Tetracentron sinense]|uniref:Uncharacterized protein n=1 Tax=Tetracentron sinense TaxID=13715 RepID=A0A834YFK4_TETSI|nr:hypothetical protein HHK36_028357 [Tetracentron sinense]
MTKKMVATRTDKMGMIVVAMMVGDHTHGGNTNGQDGDDGDDSGGNDGGRSYASCNSLLRVFVLALCEADGPLTLAQAEQEKEYPEDLPLALPEMEHEEAPVDMSTMQALDNAREIHKIKGSIIAIFESLKSLTMAQASNRPIL